MEGNEPFAVLGDRPLNPEPPPRPSYARRIQRAHDLAAGQPAAAEILNFYARLAFHQQHIFQSLGKKGVGALSGADHAPDRSGATEPAGSWPLEMDLVFPLFAAFVRFLGEISPAAMRDRISSLAASSATQQVDLLTRFWSGGLREESSDTFAECFISLAFLQPYAEWLAQSGHGVPGTESHAVCPVCSSEPVCAVLRDQDHGARRSLVCSLCMNEWTYRRSLCPACGEHRFESLPVFAADKIRHVRVDACETCHHYFKTVDMTKDGLAVPVVDELAAVSLDLWAAGNGYKKLLPNLAGL